MRNIVIGLIFLLIIVFSVGVVVTVSGRNIRNQEVSDALDTAVEGVINNLSDKAYTIENSDEFVADMISALLLQIESDSEIEVKVLDKNLKTGLLSIEITEKYKHINGNTGSVSAYKTVILEKKESENEMTDTETATIEFYLPGDIMYKKYTVEKGSEVHAPTVLPDIDGKVFECWTMNDTVLNLDTPIKVEEDVKIIAMYK